MKVREGIYWVGTLNPTLRIFDVIMRTDYGTTYNAYLVMDDKIALIDANHGPYTGLFLEKIRAHVDPAKIDYVVAHHSEPDHTGSLGRVLDLCPQALVVCTKAAARFLPEILNRQVNCRAVEDGEEISLGKKTLRFMSIPFWHWPDTMFTYVPEERLLFTCDGFGAHFCDERMYDDLVAQDLYATQFKHYYDSIMRPFADKIYDGVQRVKQLEIEMICPSHGPILRSQPWEAVRLYEAWSFEQKSHPAQVAVFYASAYGNTRRMAEAVAEGARKHVPTTLLNAAEMDVSAIRDTLEASKGVLLGSCTINGDALAPIWQVLDVFPLLNRRGKVGAAFGSYGWSGEAVPMLEERMRGLKLKVVEGGPKVLWAPTEDDLAQCRAFGEEFAKGLG